MAKSTKCENCGKAVEEGKGLTRPFGTFCSEVCLKTHLNAPSKQTVANKAEDAKRIEEASITMKANKGKMGKAKAKGSKAAKAKDDGRVNLEIVPSADSKREIDPESKTRFKLGTRLFEALARIVQLVKQGKTVADVKHWMEENVPGTGYWRICTSAHPEWFKINADGTAKYSGPELKVVTMDHSPKPKAPKAKVTKPAKATKKAKAVKKIAKKVAKKAEPKAEAKAEPVAAAS